MNDPLTVNDVDPYTPQYTPKKKDTADQAKKKKSLADADGESPSEDEQDPRPAAAPEHLGGQLDLEV